MKIKDREHKKELMTLINECKMRSNNVITELRNINLNNIPNEVIAKLNDIAYKAIAKGSLNKLLDKRALQNEELYNKLDSELKDITSKLNINELEKKYGEIIKDIGDCPISCLSTLDAMQEADCMCIGLEINRPEAAIADPSRLVIKDIFPTYISAESFLMSAQFKLQENSDAHGGFGPNKDGQLALGLGNEKITGIMPLYLFQEHWNLAKRKIQPVFGFMCTLDIMGYSSEQFFTIPFLVYIRALTKCKENPTEINQKMLQLIEQTCLKIVETSPTFKAETLNKIVQFVL